MMEGLDFKAACEDIRGAYNFLKQKCKKVGIFGFCMGGALVLAALS